jgi:GGDEF-like domain/PucR C-terminal helix-turn-helix domain
MRHSANGQAQGDLLCRLRDRRPEIEEAIFTRVVAIADPQQVSDPLYADGLRAAVVAAVTYSLDAIELGEDGSPPPALLAQARLAARNKVTLDMVLRRCFAGQAVIADFIVEEAQSSAPLAGTQLQRLLRAQAAAFDRLVAEVTEEYANESGNSSKSSAERRAGQVKRLLAGEPIDTAGLGYDFEGHHLGLVASGTNAAEVIRELSASLDRQILLISDTSNVWAWLGGRHRLDSAEIQRQIHSSASRPLHASLAVGECETGLGGWRLTHRQAGAALPVGLRRGDGVVRYRDVALLASALQDDLLATSLRQLYLAPLERVRDGGASLRETLSVYFAVERNVSSAASQLGVARETVANRLRMVERLLGGRSLAACAVELESALRLHEHTTWQIPRSEE